MILSRLKDKWDREYQEQGIPSSVRAERSGALAWGLSQLPALPSGAMALDVGCGAGRNSLYLAAQGLRVTGVDISATALHKAKHTARDQGLQDRVNFICQPVQDGLPCADATQDLVVDMYVSFHIGENADRLALWQDVSRVLKPDGFFVFATPAHNDGYYGTLPTLTACGGQAKLVHDAKADVPIMLYDAPLLVQETSTRFDLLAFCKERPVNAMYGKDYQRSNLFAVFQKKILGTS